VGAVEKRRALRAAVVAMERNMMAVVVCWFGLVVFVDLNGLGESEMDLM
jgi:hypothetical protein